VKLHYHMSIDQGALAFLYWIAFYNLWRILAAWLVARDNSMASSVGAAMGGLIHSGR
jgi:hypothetical protein